MNYSVIFGMMHDRLYIHLIDVLDGLNDEQMMYAAPVIDERVIRDVAIHAYRPVLAVACVLVGEEWPVRPVLPTNRDELMVLLEQMSMQIYSCVSKVGDEVWRSPLMLPWGQQESGFQALFEVIAHGLVHVGNIQGIRAFGGFPTPAEEAKPPRGNS